MSFLRTFAFASVTFMFTTIALSCFHFNKCFFHVIFSMACVNFNVVCILQVSFSLFSYFHKCCLLAWEVSHIVKAELWFIARDNFGTSGYYISYRHAFNPQIFIHCCTSIVIVIAKCILSIIPSRKESIVHS